MGVSGSVETRGELFTVTGGNSLGQVCTDKQTDRSYLSGVDSSC